MMNIFSSFKTKGYLTTDEIEKSLMKGYVTASSLFELPSINSRALAAEIKDKTIEAVKVIKNAHPDSMTSETAAKIMQVCSYVITINHDLSVTAMTYVPNAEMYRAVEKDLGDGYHLRVNRKVNTFTLSFKLH